MSEIASELAQSVRLSEGRVMALTTGMQLRMARAGLGMSQQDAAARASCSVATLRRAEAEDGVPRIGAQVLWRLERMYRDAGVEFIPDGVRMRRADC